MYRKNKIIITFVISLLLILFCASTSLAVTCSDVAKDGYEGINTPTLLNGGLDFEKAVGQITNANFLDIYDFFVNGVDINKIKNNKLEETYINSLNEIMKEMENEQGADTTSAEGADIKAQIERKYGTTIEEEKQKISNILNEVGASEDQKEDIEQSYDDIKNMQDAKNSTNKQDAVNAVADAVENDKNYIIYKNPDREDETTDTAKDIDGLIADGDGFLAKANNLQGAVNIAGLQDFSNAFYNILFAIGIVASVIVGMILGIKLMLASPEGKAELKQYILPYIIGCVVIFAGFGIWKLVVTILANV